MNFDGIKRFWGRKMMYLDFQRYDQQDGMTKTVTMSESSFFENISAYLAENRLKTALEAEVKIMAIKANEETNHAKGPGIFFKPKPPDEEKPIEEKDQRLDAIYNDGPLGFEKDPVASNAKMLAQDPLEEVDLGDGIVKRPMYVSSKLSPGVKAEVVQLLKKYKDCFF